MTEAMHAANADPVPPGASESARLLQGSSRGASRSALTLALGVFALGVMPFVALSFYAHPQNDDFLFAVMALEKGWAHANAFWYLNWTGRFTSTAIMSMSPVVFRSVATYQWAAACVITVLWLSTWAAISAAAPVGTSRPRRFLLSTTLLAMFLNGMPDVGQGLYFMTGAVTYQAGGALLLLVWAFTLRGRGSGSSDRQRPLLVAAVAVATLLAAGTNEIVALLSVGVLAYRTLVVRLESSRLDRTLVLLLLVALSAASVALLSPGNQVRAASQERDLAAALVGAVEAGASFGWQWISRTPLVPVAVLLLPSLAAGAPARRRTVHPAVAVLAFVATYLACFVPPLFGGGLRDGDEVVMAPLEPRTLNLIFGFFVVGFLAVLRAVASWYGGGRGFSWPPAARVGFTAAAVALAVAPGNARLRTAWGDLLSGSAAEYDRGQSERYRAIASCPTAICAVPPVVLPSSLSAGDNAIDPRADGPHIQSYKQISYAAYFGKMGIVLARQAP